MAAATAPARGPAEQALRLHQSSGEKNHHITPQQSAEGSSLRIQTGHTPAGPPPLQPHLVRLCSRTRLPFGPMGLQPGSLFRDALLSPQLCPLALNSAVLFLLLGSPVSVHNSPGPDSQGRLEGRPSPGFASVPCLLMATGHGATASWGRSFLRNPQQRGLL